MNTNGIERWRTVLAWGCVIIFLGMPPLLFFMHATGLLEGITENLGYLRSYYYSIAGVLVSLAGLNTVQLIKNGKNHAGWTPSRHPPPPRTTEAKLERIDE
jgi:hypothetical protein